MEEKEIDYVSKLADLFKEEGVIDFHCFPAKGDISDNELAKQVYEMHMAYKRGDFTTFHQTTPDL
jgi:hypothetical protein